MSVRSIITSEFEQVARELELELAPLTDDLTLIKSGLNSLSLAMIVARLEEQLGVDPFDADDFAEFPVTFGDFVRLYESPQTAES